LQRVSEASVEVDGERIAEIGTGLLALVAAGTGDKDQDARRLAEKIARLRIFGDQHGRMNRSVIDVAGSVLCVSQFTLYADVARGNRPGFTGAAPPELGRRLYERMLATAGAGHEPVAGGVFGAEMLVSLVTDGPVTIPITLRD